MTVSRQAVRAAGQVNAVTVRLGPEVLPEQGAPQAKVAQAVRRVDKAAGPAQVDGPVALAGNPQAAGPQALGVLRPREVPPEAAVAPVPAVHQLLAAFQRRVVSPQREARAARAVHARMAAVLVQAAQPQLTPALEAVAPAAKVARWEPVAWVAQLRTAEPPARAARQAVQRQLGPRRPWVGIPGTTSDAARARR